MTQQYRPDLLAPFLALDQGEKVQAECTSPIYYILFCEIIR